MVTFSPLLINGKEIPVGRWRFLRRFAMTLGTVGIASSSFGQTGFGSVAEARRYLSENPTGSRAAEAFRAIVNADLAAEFPQYPREGIARGQVRIGSGAGLSGALIEEALRDAAGVPGATEAPQPVRDDDDSGGQYGG